MNIIIKQVDCTNDEFLDYYLREENLELCRELHPINGFPAGFLAIDTATNQVIGAAMLIDEEMHNQIPSYDPKDNDTNPWMIAVNVNKINRNKGIGKQLVDSMIEYCAALNYPQLNANTETAKEFYEKHWQINLVSSYPMTNEKNEKVLTHMFRIDVENNLTLTNQIINKKINLNKLFKI